MRQRSGHGSATELRRFLETSARVRENCFNDSDNAAP